MAVCLDVAFLLEIIAIAILAVGTIVTVYEILRAKPGEEDV